MGAPRLKRWVLIAAALLAGIVATGCALFYALVVWPSNKTLERHASLAKNHPNGSSLQLLLDDDFVKSGVALVRLTGDFEATAEVPTSNPKAVPPSDVLRQFAVSSASHDGGGHVHLMWYYLLPFGRVMFDADFERGVLSNVRLSSLD